MRVEYIYPLIILKISIYERSEYNMFQDYWKEKIEYDTNKSNNMIEMVSPSNSPLFNNSILFKNIEDRNSMTDVELRIFIENSFLSIINNIFNHNQNTYVKYVKAFEDPRFLNAFIDVLQNMKYFETDVIIKCNLLAYHYITSDERFKNKEITKLMIRMSSIVNYNNSIKLKKFNLPENLENILLLARYSDFNISISIKRVNLLMITSPILYDMLDINEYEASDYSVNFLANLLFELYPSDQWIYVLPYFMVDVLPDYDEKNPHTRWITPEVESMSSALNLAVLKILNEKIDDSMMLERLLYSYAEGYNILNYRMPTRFSFQSISFEYERLSKVIYNLKDQGIYVP